MCGFNKVHMSSMGIQRHSVGKICVGLLGEVIHSTRTETGLSEGVGHGVRKLVSASAMVVPTGGSMFMMRSREGKWHLSAPLFLEQSLSKH